MDAILAFMLFDFVLFKQPHIIHLLTLPYCMLLNLYTYAYLSCQNPAYSYNAVFLHLNPTNILDATYTNKQDSCKPCYSIPCLDSLHLLSYTAFNHAPFTLHAVLSIAQYHYCTYPCMLSMAQIHCMYLSSLFCHTYNTFYMHQIRIVLLLSFCFTLPPIPATSTATYTAQILQAQTSSLLISLSCNHILSNKFQLPL